MTFSYQLYYAGSGIWGDLIDDGLVRKLAGGMRDKIAFGPELKRGSHSLLDYALLGILPSKRNPGRSITLDHEVPTFEMPYVSIAEVRDMHDRSGIS